ncbi:MAG: ABC transporter ATP-binding protein [Gemmatimonadales bacterium]|nr:MAG: ABC transporter ATP-binding protein [Gemmatimonadales bacterium]
MTFETRDLSVRYGPSGPWALEEVSMAVPPGEIYAVLGPNGSGKSTLMKALLGTVPVTRGEALVGGRSVGAWRRRELARSVGAVSQTESTAFPISVRKLVEMGRYPHLGALSPMTPEDHRAVDAALRRCRVLELADRLVDTLSGGEFQRVRIARALAQEPCALVLDEPTASLDIRHEMGILQLLRESARDGVTILLVTHHLNLAARFAHRALLLDGGRVAAQGPVREVFQPEVLEPVYQWPLSVGLDPITGSPTVTPLD